MAYDHRFEEHHVIMLFVEARRHRGDGGVWRSWLSRREL
jgi:hypothetical protein